MATTVSEIKREMTASWKTITFYAAFLLDTRDTFPFSVNTGTDVFTATGHTYINGQRVRQSQSGGALPSPLVANTDTYIRDAATNTFKLALTSGGAAIDITTAGSGTLTVTDVALNNRVELTAEFIRKEIPDYYGLTNRPAVTPSTDPVFYTESGIDYYRILTSVAIDNTLGVGDLVFNQVALIRGGTSSQGNTTGTVAAFTDLLSTKTILAGQTDTLTVPFLRAI
jgi:hypothetical protein